MGNSITDPILWLEIKKKRAYLLKECDWIDLPHTPITDKEPWLEYRQALRDIPQNFTDPETVVWPTPPFDLRPIEETHLLELYPKVSLEDFVVPELSGTSIEETTTPELSGIESPETL